MEFEQFSGIIKDLGGLVNSILAISAFVTLVLSPVRKSIVKILKKSLSIDSIEQKLDGYIARDDEKKKRAEERDDQVMQIKTMLEEHITGQKRTEDEQNECDLFQLRQEILSVYYKYRPLNYLPSYQRENLIKGYDIYTRKGGNSFIASVVEELLGLEVKF